MDTIRRRLLILFIGFFCLMGISILTIVLHTSKKGAIVIGAKNCTEGQVISEIIAQLIESELDVEVVRKYALDGTFVSFNALKAKDIDLYVEYTGSAYMGILRKSVLRKKREEILEELREHFSREYGIRWMEPLGFQNSYVLLVNASFSEKYGVKTLSDLSHLIQKGKEIRIGFDPEFYGRPEGEMIQSVYKIPLRNLKLMDHSLLYMTLFRGSLEVINGYATDGFALGRVVLEDDLKSFPSYEAVPIIREDILQKFPKLEGVLHKLNGLMNEEEVRQMNYAVENKGESIYTVASIFLKNHQLIHDSIRAHH